MKIYANLDELVPHLDEIDGWLYVDEDQWAQNPATAEIYLFAEEEAEYCVRSRGFCHSFAFVLS